MIRETSDGSLIMATSLYNAKAFISGGGATNVAMIRETSVAPPPLINA